MGAINGTKTLQLIHDELTNNGLTRYTRQDIDNILKTLRRHPSGKWPPWSKNTPKPSKNRNHTRRYPS